MGKVDGRGGGGGGADGGRKSRWGSRFQRFFSCVGLGGEATSSFDLTDAPTTPPVNQPTVATQLPAPSASVYANADPDEPEAPAAEVPCEGRGFCTATAAAPEQPAETETATETSAVDPDDQGEEEDTAGITLKDNLTASSDSLDMYVADYVERCRSIKRRDPSFPDIFSRVPGCRPKLLFASHAAHLRNMAPWMELSYDVDSTPTPKPEYNAKEFGNVDISCLRDPSVDGASDTTDSSFRQTPSTEVTVTEIHIIFTYLFIHLYQIDMSLEQ